MSRESMNEMGEFVGRILKKGTIADKLAAHTLLIHEALNFSSLNSLIEMVDPRKCRRECVMAIDTLKELFLDSLSPNNQSLKDRCQNGRTGSYEDVLAKLRFNFTKFIDKLELVAFDTIDSTRFKAITTLADLLQRYPENKKYILQKLINKIGDRTPKIATRASFLIEKMINTNRQPLLKQMAIDEAERFLKRSSNSGVIDKAQYYILCLLNHVILERNDYETANKLLNIYLGYFERLIKFGNVDTKFMGAILTGINRAYPFSKIQGEIFEQQLQVLYTIVHYVNFSMSIQAMSLIHAILVKREATQSIPIEDRFYNCVYGQLLHPELCNCARQKSFMNLLFTLITQDKVPERRRAFIKRMGQVACGSPPNFTCTLIVTINRILSALGGASAIALFSKNSEKPQKNTDKSANDSKNSGTGLKDQSDKADDGKQPKRKTRKEILQEKLLKFRQLEDDDDDDEEGGSKNKNKDTKDDKDEFVDANDEFEQSPTKKLISENSKNGKCNLESSGDNDDLSFNVKVSNKSTENPSENGVSSMKNKKYDQSDDDSSDYNSATSTNSDDDLSDNEDNGEDNKQMRKKIKLENLNENKSNDSNSAGPVDLSKIELSATKSWLHRSAANHALINDNQHSNKDYDPLARNPRYANANKSSLWEMLLLKRHFHPSVSIFTSQAFRGDYVEYTGDPIVDFSIKNFLDKFAKKQGQLKQENAKAAAAAQAAKSRLNESKSKSLKYNQFQTGAKIKKSSPNNDSDKDDDDGDGDDNENGNTKLNEGNKKMKKRHRPTGPFARRPIFPFKKSGIIVKSDSSVDVSNSFTNQSEAKSQRRTETAK